MYFCGETTCFLCGLTDTLRADVASHWRAIKAEKRVYYFCVYCQPDSDTVENWESFYVRAVTKIYERDFRRPIRKLLILRDTGGNPEISTRI